MGYMNGRVHNPEPMDAFDEAVRRLLQDSQYGTLASIFVTLRRLFEEELNRPIQQ